MEIEHAVLAHCPIAVRTKDRQIVVLSETNLHGSIRQSVETSNSATKGIIVRYRPFERLVDQVSSGCAT